MSTATIRVRVARKTQEALDICSYELVATDGTALPGFSAGSHVDVHLPGGLTRQYSLCNDASETHRYLVGVLRDPASRGGSLAMHDTVQEGDVLQISAPKNHFPLAHGASRSLLLAGGIGVTPILCMAERLSVLGGKFEMHYATRSRDRTAFAARIQQAPYASRVQFHFDDGAPEQKLDVGRVLTGAGAGTHLYVCGPKGFMDHVLSTAHAQGWPEAEMHYEFFGAVVAKTDEDQSFRVKLASSGRIILVAAGVEVPTSCEQGVCGTCLTRVLEGEPDHKDFYLTPAEQAANDQFMPCCSRSKSPMLVLEL